MISQKPAVIQLMILLGAQVVSIIGMCFHSSIIGCLVMHSGRAHKWPRTSLLTALCQSHHRRPAPPPFLSFYLLWPSVFLFAHLQMVYVGDRLK